MCGNVNSTAFGYGSGQISRWAVSYRGNLRGHVGRLICLPIPLVGDGREQYWRMCGSSASVGEVHQVELAEARRVGDRVDGDYLPLSDSESEDEE
jgi:hypothetical protein